VAAWLIIDLLVLRSRLQFDHKVGRSMGENFREDLRGNSCLIAVASPAGKQVIVGWRADCECNSHGSVDPLTVITVIASGDHDIDRPLAPGPVVPGHLLRAANVFDVQPERVAGLHLPEQIFLVGLSLGDHRSPCWFWASLKGLFAVSAVTHFTGSRTSAA
jgi:hypothetical protein